MRCEEIMKRDVQCVQPTDPVQAAARRMRDANIGFLPVCDSSRKVLGAITDRDIALRIVADGRPPTTAIGDVMTREVVACAPGDDVRRAEELMGKQHKSRMIVADEEWRLVGVISLSDIAQVEDASRASQTMKQVTEREARPH
ncbi:MAG TPA: CBS domain-containing protein [Myxococcales bacterium]|nr:CBS domain-containing protein [Myxococcales bacterium]